MTRKINLIISTYGGRYYKFDSSNKDINKDKENYLKYNLLLINANMNNLDQITIMRPRINKEHSEIPNYYNFDNLKIDNIRHKIKIYDCENIGISYGQFFTAIFKECHFDYHIFIEDDYFPFIDYFDENLVTLLNSFNDETYLCSFVNQNKINIFKKLENFNDSKVSNMQLNNYFKKYNVSNFDIVLPDFSLGIISKNSVEKLIKTYNNIDNVLELYNIKFNKNWVYQVLFGYTFTIAGIKMSDYNHLYLNIFFESSNNKLYLCNVGSKYYKIWKNVISNTKYRIPLFMPLDILFPNNYDLDLLKFQNYLYKPYLFNIFFKKYNSIKKIHMKKIYEKRYICIYINNSHINYMPFLLYASTILGILNNINHDSNINIFITSSIDEVKNKRPQILFLFSIFINEVIPYFYPEQHKYIINTEYYKNWNIEKNLDVLNNRYNINFIEYNPLNMNLIQDKYKNINCLFMPQLYHKSLISYYNMNVINRRNYYQKDIDILFYGNEKGIRRQVILSELSKKYNVKIIHKIENNILCDFIDRSKIVLNIFDNECNKPFDYYRNIFLLSNKILLISEYPSNIDLTIEPYFNNIKDELLVPEYNDIISCVENTLKKYNNYSYINNIIEKQTIFVEKIKMYDTYTNFFHNLIK